MASNEPWERGGSGGYSRGTQAVHGGRWAETAATFAQTPTSPPVALSRRDALRALSVLAKPLAESGYPFRGSDNDATLAALSAELREVEATARRLLVGDDRDAENIPGYLQLADRSAVLVEALGQVRAEGWQGLLAKARAVAIRDALTGYDGATSIAISLAIDVAVVFGRNQRDGMDRPV